MSVFGQFSCSDSIYLKFMENQEEENFMRQYWHFRWSMKMVQIPLIKETLISMVNLQNKMNSVLKFNNIFFTEASFFTKSLHYLFQWRIKYRFHYSKQMKLEIPMGNLKLTRIEPIFLLCFILLHICTQHNNIGRMSCRS